MATLNKQTVIKEIKKLIRKVMKLADQGKLEASLFDEYGIGELSSDEDPEQRLIACYNPLMAEGRKREREELLEATEEALQKVMAEVKGRKKKMMKKEDIGL